MANVSKTDLNKLAQIEQQLKEAEKLRQQLETKIFTEIGKEVFTNWNMPEYPASLTQTIKDLTDKANSKMSHYDDLERAKYARNKEETQSSN